MMDCFVKQSQHTENNKHALALAQSQVFLPRLSAPTRTFRATFSRAQAVGVCSTRQGETERSGRHARASLARVRRRRGVESPVDSPLDG